MSVVLHEFVSTKINKVRWQASVKDKFYFEPVKVFAAGSWDDIENNSVSFWECYQDSPDPTFLTQVEHIGDVTDMEFCRPSALVTASSSGAVNLFSWNKESKVVKQEHSWSDSHCLPCTGLAVWEDELCSVGEDGRIIHYDLGSQMRTVVDSKNSCSLTAVKPLRYQEILTGNLQGHLRMWDLRQGIPLVSVPTGERQSSIWCIDTYPGQPHVVATGGEAGLLHLWDLRKVQGPVEILSSGSSATLMEIHFHPSCPSQLYTCSLDGSVLRWDISTSSVAPAEKQTNPWLSKKMETIKIDSIIEPLLNMPINSVDIRESTLVCGSDSGSILLVSGLQPSK